MAIILEKTFHIPEPIDSAWKLLSNVTEVVKCVPGARITEQVNERTFKGSVSMKMGPTVANYSGTVEILRMDAVSHEIELLGKGKDAGGKGSASLKMMARLKAAPDGGTEVTGKSEMNVVGILAQVGSRVFSEVSNYLFNEFTRNVKERLQAKG